MSGVHAIGGTQEDKFGPLQPSTRKLLNRAQRLASKQPLDTLHILLAAIEATDPDLLSSQVLATHVDERHQARLIRVIKDDLAEVEAEAVLDGLTSRLNVCKAIWTQKANEGSLLITDTLILWAILSKDPRTSEIMDFCKLDAAPTIAKLEGLFEKDMPPSPPPTTIPPPASKPRPLRPAPDPKVKAMSFTEVIQPVSLFPDSVKITKEMHSVPAMGAFLLALGKSARSPKREIVIIAGHNGSATKEMPQVLAYRLNSEEHFQGWREPLNHYKLVHKVDMEALRREAEPGKILAAAKAYALEKRAILMLDNIDAVKGHTAIDEKIKKELVDRGEGLIFGRWEYYGRPHDDFTLGLKNVTEVKVEPYHTEATKAFLSRYCYPAWNAAGYTFAENAFESVMKLEPGAFIDNERMTLPYLAVTLGEGAFQTLLEGEESIKGTARCALEAFTELFDVEQPPLPDEQSVVFIETLKQGKADTLALLEQPFPEGPNVITRAHVISQLICHNDSEFHFHPFYPDLCEKSVQGESEESGKMSQKKH